MEINLTKKQTLLMRSEAQQILYGGACGGGKSHAARVLSILYASQISNLNVYLFRRHSQDINLNHFSNSIGSYPNLLGEYIQCKFANITYSPTTIRFSNGSTIYTHHCQHEKDLEQIQGAEIHILIIDEATQFSESMYRFLRSRVRITQNDKMIQEIQDLSNALGFNVVLPKIICTANPGGIGHSFFKRTFIDPNPPEIIFDDNDSDMTTQFIPALLEDNPHLDFKAYSKQLEGLGSPALIAAYLKGDWTVVIGGSALEGAWDPFINVIKPFTIPANWEITRSMDWGDTAPFAVTYFAESNGEDQLLPDGNVIISKPGDLFLIRELYSGDEKDKGDGTLASTAAKMVKSADQTLPSRVNQSNSPADTSMWAVLNGKNIIDDFKREGVNFVQASKGPGSRVTGLIKLREYLVNAHTHSSPSLRIFDTCRNTIRTLPLISRSKTTPEDADTDGPDHLYDAIRYKLLTRKHKMINTSNIVGLV